MNSYKLKKLFSFIIIAIIPFCISLSVKAATYETDLAKNEIKAGEEFSLPIVIKADSNQERYAQKFSCKITINSDYITYKKRIADTKITRNIRVNKDKNKPNELFLTFSPPEKRPREIDYSEDGKSKLFELVFLTKSDAKAGDFSIKCDFTNPDDEKIINSNEVCGKLFESPIIENCKLSSLVSSCGELNPKFDPNIFEYSINVPSSQKEIYFDYCPAIEGLKVNINRKRLLKAGETTEILITVHGPKRGIKNVYVIKVNRAPEVNSDETNVELQKNTNVFSNRPENFFEKSCKKKLTAKRGRKKSTKSRKSSLKKSDSNSEEADYCDSDDSDDNECDEENEITDEIIQPNASCNDENIFSRVKDNPKTIYIIVLIILLIATTFYLSIKFIKRKSLNNKNESVN